MKEGKKKIAPFVLARKSGDSLPGCCRGYAAPGAGQLGVFPLKPDGLHYCKIEHGLFCGCLQRAIRRVSKAREAAVFKEIHAGAASLPKGFSLGVPKEIFSDNKNSGFSFSIFNGSYCGAEVGAPRFARKREDISFFLRHKS